MIQEYDRFGLPVLTPKDVRRMKVDARKQKETEFKIVSHKRTFLQIVRNAFTPLHTNDKC